MKSVGMKCPLSKLRVDGAGVFQRKQYLGKRWGEPDKVTDGKFEIINEGNLKKKGEGTRERNQGGG